MKKTIISILLIISITVITSADEYSLVKFNNFTGWYQSGAANITGSTNKNILDDMKIDFRYTYSGTSRGDIKKSLYPLDFTAGDSISITAAGSVSSCTIIFFDTGSKETYIKIDNLKKSFTTYIYNIKEFNGNILWQSVAGYKCKFLSEGVNDTLYIKDINLLYDTSSSSFPKLDFNSGDTSGITSTTDGSTVSFSISRFVYYGNSGKSLQIDYDLTAPDENLDECGVSVDAGLDTSVNYDYIVFNIRGAYKNNKNKFYIIAGDGTYNYYTLPEEVLLNNDMTSDWDTVFIPLPKMDISKTKIIFKFYRFLASEKNTIWVDNIRYVKQERRNPLIHTISDENYNSGLYYYSYNSDDLILSVSSNSEDSFVKIVSKKAGQLSLISNFYTGLNDNSIVSLVYKYNGSANSLNIVLYDTANTEYRVELQLNNTGNLYDTVNIPFSKYSVITGIKNIMISFENSANSDTAELVLKDLFITHGNAGEYDYSDNQNLFEEEADNSLLIDDFSRINKWKSSVQTSMAAGKDGAPYSAVKLTFSSDFSYGGIEKKFNSIDLSMFDGFELYIKGSGGAYTIKPMFKDVNGIYTSASNVTSLSSNWKKLSFEFDKTAQFDFSKVRYLDFDFAKTSAAPGSVSFDNLSFYVKNDRATEYYMFDDFNHSANNSDYKKNTFFGTWGDEASSISLKIDKTAGVSGQSCLRMDYSLSSEDAVRSLWFVLWVDTGVVDLSDYDYLSFYIKGADGGERPKIGLHDENGIDNRNNWWDIESLLDNGITTEWQEVRLYFLDLIEFYKLNLQFEFKGSKNKPEGSIYIDDLKFVKRGVSAGYKKNLDDFEYVKPGSWWKWNNDNAKIDYTLDEGYTGAGLKYDYELYNSDGNVTFGRNLYLNLNSASSIKFDYKYSGLSNYVYLMLQDNDSFVVYSAKQIQETNGSWNTLTFNLDEFQEHWDHWGYADSITKSAISLSDINKIRISFEGNNALKNAANVLTIDNLRMALPSGAQGQNMAGGEVAGNFTIQNALLAPDGSNSARDKNLILKFDLNEPASAKLKIYDTRGQPVANIEKQGLTAGTDRVIIWNGKDYNGQVVRNGVYLFKLKVEGISGKVDSFIKILAVVKK